MEKPQAWTQGKKQLLLLAFNRIVGTHKSVGTIVSIGIASGEDQGPFTVPTLDHGHTIHKDIIIPEVWLQFTVFNYSL